MRGSIVKRGNNYYACLWINGKKKWFSGAGRSKRNAEAILTEKLAEVQQGTYHETTKLLFRDFAAQWLDSYAAHRVKGSTLRSYRDIIRNHLVPAFGECRLTDITTALLQRYVSERLNAAKPVKKFRKKGTGKDISKEPEKPPLPFQPKTVINELVVVKEMFKHAMRWGYLKVNPAEYVERPRVEPKEMEILSPSEVRRLLEQSPPRHRTLFLMAVVTGMRRGELLALRTKDIDWKNSQILVNHSAWKGTFVPPKSKASVRRNDMSPYLARELFAISSMDKPRLFAKTASFSDQFPLHLGEAAHDVEENTACGGPCVDVANDGVEGYLVFLKEFNKPYGVFYVATEPVQLVDNYCVNRVFNKRPTCHSHIDSW